MNLKGVLFDYGHTLVYFPRIQKTHMTAAKNMKRVIKKLGVSVEASKIREILDHYIKMDVVMSWEEEFRGILKDLGVEKYNKKDLNEVIIAEVKPYIRNVTLRKGVKNLLETLKRNELRMGIVSNIWSGMMNPVLEREGIGSFFDSIIASVDVGYKKPDPKIFQITLKQLHLEPQETIMVRDDPKNDIQGAHNLGIQTVRLMRGPNRTKTDIVKPDYEIRNLTELLAILL